MKLYKIALLLLISIVFLGCSKIDHAIGGTLKKIVDPIDKTIFKPMEEFTNKSIAKSEGREYKTEKECNDEFHACFLYYAKELRKLPRLQNYPNVVIFNIARDHCNKKVKCRKDYGYK